MKRQHSSAVTAPKSSIDELERLSQHFLSEAWKLEPVAEEYKSLKKEHKEKFDAAIHQLYDWLNQMKPENVPDSQSEFERMHHEEMVRTGYPDLLCILRTL